MEIGNKSDFLLSSLKTFENTISNSINQIEEKLIILNRKIKGLVKPILKNKNDIMKSFGKYLEDYKSLNKKIISKENFILNLSKSNPNQLYSLNIIKEEEDINNKIINDKNYLNIELDKLNTKIILIDKIMNIEEYNNLIKNLDKNKDEDLTESVISDKELENLQYSSIDEKEDNKNDDNHNNISNRKLLNNKRIRINDKQKKKLIKFQKKEKKVNDDDILNLLKRKYKSSKYIKKLTKTFIKRRLNHKIIYEQTFDYKNIENITNNLIRSSGSKTPYKYVKFIFELVNNEKKEEIINDISKEIFQNNFFIQINENIIEFAGKINKPLNDIIINYFNKILFQKYNIISSKILSYEFYEELINEYDISNPNVKPHFDDKTLNKLMDNWKMLNIVRQFINNYKLNNKN